MQLIIEQIFSRKSYLLFNTHYKNVLDKKLKDLSKNEFSTLSYVINKWKDINFIATENRRLFAHFSDGTSEKLSMLSLDKIKENYPYKNIMRVHRSTIINTDKVAAFGYDTVTLNDGTELPIGVTYRDEKFNVT